MNRNQISTGDPAARPSRTAPALLAALIVASLLVVADTYRSISHTWDEPAHLVNGLMLLDDGKYIEYQHPPLARLAMAIGPYLAGERANPPEVLPKDFAGRVIQSFDEGREVLYGSGAYDRVLTLARLGILPFLGLLLVATYVWTRGMLGRWTALLAALLVAATPIVLGNAGIATLDLPLTALAIVCLILFCRWLERPTLLNGAALGAAVGAATMTKFSALPFLGLSFMAIAVWFVCVRLVTGGSVLADLRVRMQGTALAVLALVVVGWLSFGGGFVSIANPANRPYDVVDRFVPAGTANALVSDALELPVVPYFLWAMKEGVQDLSYHNRIGHRTYLLGETGDAGWWHYYLVGLAVRTPLPLLVAGICGLAMMLWSGARRGDWRPGAPALTFIAILAFSSVFSRINLGIRHILILYPLMAIGMAYLVVWLVTGSARRRLASVAAAALVLLHLGSAISAHPDHVSYFNALAGDRPERFLIMADLDWGQDMKRLEAEVAARGIRKLAISFNGSNDVTKHALPGVSVLKPKMPESGWVAVSIWRLYRNEDFAWLRDYEPVARVGRSVNLYYIDGPETAAPPDLITSTSSTR